MVVAATRCHTNPLVGTVIDVPRPATGKTFVARARVALDLWEEFGKSAEALGTDRSKLINEFIRWHLRKQGAKTPPRTAPSSEQTAAGE